MPPTSTKKGNVVNGKKRKNITTSSQQGSQTITESKVYAITKKRGRQRPHPGPGQKEEKVTSPVLVLIDWVDSFGCSTNWQRIDGMEHLHPMRCQSAGWLVHQDGHYVVMIPHLSIDDHEQVPHQGCGDMAIPRQAIRSVKPLTTPSGQSRPQRTSATPRSVVC